MDKRRTPSVLMPALSSDLEFTDGDIFWQQHWYKFVAALLAVVLLILAAGAWLYYRNQVRSSSGALYSAAASADGWREVVTKFPASIAAGNARIRLASTLRNEGKLDEAVTELSDLAEQQPKHPMAGAAWLTIGEIRQAQQKEGDALEAYRSASGLYKDSYAAPLALVAEARLLVAKDKAGEAKAILESVGTSYPDTPAAMVAAGELARLTGRQPGPAGQ